MAVTVHVNFRQSRAEGPRGVTKDIQLAAVPMPGCWFEYEPGWGLAPVESVSILRDSIEINYYGPQFTDEEIESLKSLGWETR